MALTDEEIKLLLKEDAAAPKRGGGGRKKDNTEPREPDVWFKLLHGITEPCENPDCSDPRSEGDKGRNVTALVKEKRMCRYCFMDGWLSVFTDNE